MNGLGVASLGRRSHPVTPKPRETRRSATAVPTREEQQSAGRRHGRPSNEQGGSPTVGGQRFDPHDVLEVHRPRCLKHLTLQRVARNLGSETMVTSSGLVHTDTTAGLCCGINCSGWTVRMLVHPPNASTTPNVSPRLSISRSPARSSSPITPVPHATSRIGAKQGERAGMASFREP